MKMVDLVGPSVLRVLSLSGRVAQAAAVLVVLLVWLEADAVPLAMLPARPPCVDGRFLSDLLRADESDSMVRADRRYRTARRNVLVSFSVFDEWDVLCSGAARGLHNDLNFSMQIQAVGYNLKRPVKVAPHIVDIVVFLLGSKGDDLGYEASHHVHQVLKYFGRRTPVLVTLVGGTPADVDIVLDEMTERKWWRVSAALQEHGHKSTVLGREVLEVDAVPVYLRRLLYEPGVRCGSTSSNTTLVVTWSPLASGSTKNLLLSEGLFPPNPKSQDLHGCIVNVAPVESPPFIFVERGELSAFGDASPDQIPIDTQNTKLIGLDVELVNYFGRSKNATIQFLPVRRQYNSPWNSHWEEKEDPSEMDPMDLLVNDVADMVVGGLFPTPERYDSFTFSAMYTTDAVRCYVYRDHSVPRWQYPVAVLSHKAWGAMVVAMVCLVAALSWLNRQGVMTNAILLWGVLLEGRSMPTWMSARTSLLIFVWIIFSMHFTAGYRASLAMANTKPLTRPGPTNLDEAKPLIKRVGVLNRVAIPYLAQDGSLAELLRRVEVCNSTNNCSTMISSDPEDTALILTSRNMQFLMPRFFLNRKGRRILRALDQALYTYHVSAIVGKGSPVLLALDSAIYRAQESGLIVGWMTRFLTTANRELWSTMRRAVSGPRALTTAQIIGPLFALAAGLFVSACVFVFEVVGYQGLKVAGIETDSPPDPGDDSVPRDVGVDAPLQALKAQVEAEEQAAAEAELAELKESAEVVAVSCVPATLLADGTAILGEGEGRFERAACLEKEVMSMATSDQLLDAADTLDESAADGAEHGAATLLSNGTVRVGEAMSAVTMPGAATLLPDGTVLLGEMDAVSDPDQNFGELIVSQEEQELVSSADTLFQSQTAPEVVSEMHLGGTLVQDHGGRRRSPPSKYSSLWASASVGVSAGDHPGQLPDGDGELNDSDLEPEPGRGSH